MKGEVRDPDRAPLCALTPGDSPPHAMNTLTLRPALLAALALAALAGCTDPSDTYDSLDAAPTSVELAESETAFDAPLNAEASADVAVVTLRQSAPAGAAARPAQSNAPPDLGRHLRRSADLRVETETYDETLRNARAVASRYGGLVTGEDGSTTGETAETTLTLRIPSAQFDAALDALAGLGTVTSRQVSRR